MDNIMPDITDNEEGKKNIALRTRSHLRIDDYEPKDNLDFPDVDMNLYQNPDSEGDPEYKKFLNQCYSEEIWTTDTNNDDNDPDYVHNDDIFCPGWRYDLNELSEFHQDETGFQQSPECQTGETMIVDDNQSHNLLDIPSTSALPAFKSPSKQVRRKIDMFADPEFARILNQQLRQHIQLLTQTFLLTRNTTNMRNDSEEAKSHLSSYMKMFKNKSKPSNLLPAMELVNNLETPKDLKSSIRLSWRPLPIPDQVKNMIRDNPNVFIYPSLLPQVAFSFLPEKLIPKKPKINFTINEDKLLAYALNEFKGESAPYAFIASLLMTAKTKTQISNHIKNIKRSPGNENNPIKLYYANGQLPDINLDSDTHLIEVIKMDKKEEAEEPNNSCELKHVVVQEEQEEEDKCGATFKEEPQAACHYSDVGGGGGGGGGGCGGDSPHFYHEEHDDLMNMDLDDLMAASTTISKSTMLNVNNSESNNNKNIKNLKLKKSMLNLMSHNFLLSKDMGDLIIHEFLRTTQQKLSERNNLHLLSLLSNLVTSNNNDDNYGESKGDVERIVSIYQEITKFLTRINAPPELHERVVLFLDLDQATKCGCSLSYLHWMRFFEFMQHVELYHDGVEAFEKKLVRLLDALQKDDSHKVKLAIGNLVNKHPFLKREFESLSLDEKPHPSLFICEEDFDDLTEPIAMFNGVNDNDSIFKYEHFNSKLSKEELSYASQTCPCRCHSEATAVVDGGQLSQHCSRCNLKFMKGRMYLVNKIKPILAEWSYTSTEIATSKLPPQPQTQPPPPPQQQPRQQHQQHQQPQQQQQQLQPQLQQSPPQKVSNGLTPLEWTFEEDREILEFCRLKAEQNEETISFDTSTFEELLASRQHGNGNGRAHKKNAREIAERFNQLMDMYKDENTNVI